jgi:tetrahydromethanopterin S-methyltransferase subunit G
MKKVIFIITALALMAITLPACAAEGVSQEEYEELRQQLDVIEAKFDPLEAGLSEQLRQQIDVVVAEFGPLVAKLSEIQEELEDVHTQVAGEPMMRGKLVGQGSYAEWEDDGIHKSLNVGFILTNPDGVSEITIDRISVFAYDGRLVYEGPFLKWREEIPWDEPMKPHETRKSDLDQYVSEFEWPSESEIWMNFTVEISWTKSHQRGLPLAGWVGTAIIRRDSEGHLIEIELAGSTEMVNM